LTRFLYGLAAGVGLGAAGIIVWTYWQLRGV
jgi:hypothetical protein